MKNLSRKVSPHKKTLGKSEAREQFLPLVDAVAQGAAPINISDHGKPVAVLLSKKEYDWLLAQTQNKSKTKHSLHGSIILLDNLEEASKEIARDIQKSIEKSAREL